MCLFVMSQQAAVLASCHFTFGFSPQHADFHPGFSDIWDRNELVHPFSSNLSHRRLPKPEIRASNLRQLQQETAFFAILRRH